MTLYASSAVTRRCSHRLAELVKLKLRRTMESNKALMVPDRERLRSINNMSEKEHFNMSKAINPLPCARSMNFAHLGSRRDDHINEPGNHAEALEREGQDWIGRTPKTLAKTLVHGDGRR